MLKHCLSLKTFIPNFVAFFVSLGIVISCIHKMSFSVTLAKREFTPAGHCFIIHLPGGGHCPLSEIANQSGCLKYQWHRVCRRVATCKPGNPSTFLHPISFISENEGTGQTKWFLEIILRTCFHFSFKTLPRRKHASGSAKASVTCESGLTRKKLTGYAPGLYMLICFNSNLLVFLTYSKLSL